MKSIDNKDAAGAAIPASGDAVVVRVQVRSLRTYPRLMRGASQGHRES